MSKCINAEKLIAEIENREAELKIGNYYLDNSEQAVGYERALDDFRCVIESLQQEQPSLPSNLDEAAKEYMEKARKHLFDDSPIGRSDDAFKAGAEWMAGQGETIFDTIDVDGQGQRWLSDNLLQGDYDCGEEVIVQIRKKQ